MNAAQLGAVALVVGTAVTAYLLSQPDGVLPPIVKLVIGCINIGCTTAALYLKVNLPGREGVS